MKDLATQNNYTQVGLSFSAHNRFSEDLIVKNKGCWCCLLNNAETIEKIGGYDENCVILADYEISARLISKGFNNAIWYLYAFNHQMKSKKGGAEFIYKDIALTKQICQYLVNKYGDVCKMAFHPEHNIWEVRFDFKNLLSAGNKFLNKQRSLF